MSSRFTSTPSPKNTGSSRGLISSTGVLGGRGGGCGETHRPQVTRPFGTVVCAPRGHKRATRTRPALAHLGGPNPLGRPGPPRPAAPPPACCPPPVPPDVLCVPFLVSQENLSLDYSALTLCPEGGPERLHFEADFCRVTGPLPETFLALGSLLKVLQGRWLHPVIHPVPWRGTAPGSRLTSPQPSALSPALLRHTQHTAIG